MGKYKFKVGEKVWIRRHPHPSVQHLNHTIGTILKRDFKLCSEEYYILKELPPDSNFTYYWEADVEIFKLTPSLKLLYKIREKIKCNIKKL